MQTDVETSSPPAPPELVARAQALVETFHECVWWRDPRFKITTLEDIREVIEALRNGGHRAWEAAQSLQRCL